MAAIQIDWNPSPRTLRQFGAIGIGAFSLFAVLAHYRLAAFAFLPDGAIRPTVWVLAGLAAYCAVAAPAAPRALRPLYMLLSAIGYPIGFVISIAIFASVYYLVVTPIGLVFKLIGRDAMNRTFDPNAETYWVPRRPPANMKRYFRQF